MKKVITMLALGVIVLILMGASWPGTYPLPVFDNALINGNGGTDTSLVFDIPEDATGYFAVEYIGTSVTSTAEYQLYFEICYPRGTVYSSTLHTWILETLDWDTIWVTPPDGIIVDSVQADTARFEGIPILRGGQVRLIVIGLTNNPADTRFHARIIADVGNE